jgi:hypothetical protein
MCMKNEIEFDLEDYTAYLNFEQQHYIKNLAQDFFLDEENRFHPLAQKSQPRDWCQALEFTN